MAELTVLKSITCDVVGGAIVACLVVSYENYRQGVERNQRHQEAKGLIRSELRRHADSAHQLLEGDPDELLSVGPFQTEALRLLPVWAGFDSSAKSDRLVELSHHISVAEELNALRRAIEVAQFRGAGSDRTYEEELILINSRRKRLSLLAEKLENSAKNLIAKFF